ncbi:hypothetical protein BDF21DRAFT_395122 [Thamnidium elegans]|nr:hypothetical protein BDF21DRAFT_395122 [Thamnidium elegans]
MELEEVVRLIQMASEIGMYTVVFFHSYYMTYRYDTHGMKCFFVDPNLSCNDLYHAYNDREEADVSNGRIDNVKKNIPEDQLLVTKLDEGWKRICKFLEKDVPDVPYPRSISTTEFINVFFF